METGWVANKIEIARAVDGAMKAVDVGIQVAAYHWDQIRRRSYTDPRELRELIGGTHKALAQALIALSNIETAGQKRSAAGTENGFKAVGTVGEKTEEES